ncbi:hypothetical protein LCGC14_0881890 [marine sediment metagenome]|uniref:EF-hand domain-containing protein n=1 Tax=marine sediment metagenome TaxID=412755 RepID=A0A0F9P1J1_9ZZZZ
MKIVSTAFLSIVAALTIQSTASADPSIKIYVNATPVMGKHQYHSRHNNVYLSKKERRKLNKQFNYVDRNRDGYISKREWAIASNQWNSKKKHHSDRHHYSYRW